MGPGDPAIVADLRGIMRGVTRAGRYPTLLLPAPPVPMPLHSQEDKELVSTLRHVYF